MESPEQYEEALNYYHRMITLKPDDVEAYAAIGNLLATMNQLETAVKFLEMALKLQPGFFIAWINLGNVYKKLGELNKAANCCQSAISLQPDNAIPYNNLGNIRLQEGRLNEAATYYEQALKLKPDYADAMNNYGTVFKKMGQIENALDYYNRAISIKPDFAGAHLNKACVLLHLKKLPEGWDEYEWRLKIKEGDVPLWNFLKQVKHPEWDGSQIKDKTLLVHSEQGLGDSIQFIRFIAPVKEKVRRLIFASQPELMGLFSDSRSLGIDLLVEFPVDGNLDIDFDYHIQLLSLPRLLGIDANNLRGAVRVPYLEASPARVRKWKQRVDRSKKRVGLVWAGNPNNPDDHNRSISLADYSSLGDTVKKGSGNTLFYSLQKGAGASQCKNPPPGMKDSLIDLTEEIHDFEDTAALISNLDLVVTVDTVVAHLAGALGKPVWVIVPFDADWRYMWGETDSPWYPSMRIFRPSKPREWKPVIQRIAEELRS
jgi:Flp pilus assembly protein TadD